MLRTAATALARAPAFAVALCALAYGACPRPQPAPFVSDERGGIRLEVLSAAQAPSGPRAQGRPGDWLLASPLVRLVVARAGGRGAGAVVDATAGQWLDDALTGLGTLFELDGREVVLTVRGVEPVLSAAEPRLQIEYAGGGLTAVTDVTLMPGQRWVTLTTRLHNPGRSPRRVRIGDRLEWYGDDPFVPWVGSIGDARSVEARWLSFSGRRQFLALAFPGGPVDVGFRKREMGAQQQTAFGPVVNLAPGQSTTHVRRLVVAPGSLRAAAEHAWRASGVAPGFVEATLASLPAWAVLEARDAGGRLVQSVRSTGGTLLLPAPPGSYQLTLRSPGGVDRGSAVLRAGETTRVELIPPTPALLSYRVSDPGGSPLSARLVVTGVAPTVNPDLGPYHLAAGAANVACTASGSGSLQLPPGRYSVLATRGPEYDVDEQIVDVSASQGATLRARLARVVDTSGWIAADLHLHADPSGDSEVPLADRVTSLVAEGVELAVATDHNHVTDYAPVVRQLGLERQLTTQPGVELTTGNWGHFNAYPYPLGTPLPPLDVTPAALFASVRELAPQALIQVNHPRMGNIGYFNQIELDAAGASTKGGASLDFDLVEVWNGFDLTQLDVLEQGLSEWMRSIGSGRRVTAVGNSDSHRIAFQWAGYPRTYVRAEKAEWGEVAASLRAGRVVVTSGPFIDLRVDGESPGALVRAEQGTVGLELEVRAPPWIGVERAELLLDGKLAMQVDASAPERDVGSSSRARLRFVGGLPVSRDAFLIVVVRGTTSLERVLPGTKVVPVAFTNPVFIDGDGDGRFTPRR
ncbi:MAG: CehA/McbA family metallohydrolase [Polyangiaceae bacterium]|nr:CehA/McbA family metallohydrolase [Polyangiaceae bacterium]